ncbi:MAG: C4-dicarboxylate transporter, DctM subunit [Variibacter sp.]|nr:C4-dicarboxylate transporter, DctM subunit [Variibacter sp.]
MVIGVPIAATLGIATLAAIVWDGRFSTMLVPQKLFAGLDSFPLLAIPFFILAAEMMSGGRLTEVLLRFASACVGHIRGGLGHANILTMTFFSGISGSALADAAGPGSLIMKMMRQSGYHPEYAAAMTAAAAIVGPIIPPSIIMVVYALTDNSVSVVGLFLAGVIPGLLIALALLMVNQWISIRRNYRAGEERPSLSAFIVITWRALPALLLPFIILGGIHSGAFTPTEASAVAVFYAWLAGRFIYRTLTLDRIPAILVRSAVMTAGVMLIISTSEAFAWALTVLQIPQAVSEYIVSLQLSPLMFMFAVNIFLLLFGIFIEPLPGIMILVPILAPVADAVGINPLQFAMIVILNLTLGMITPPVGGLLFVTSIVSKVPMGAMVRELWPLLGAEIVVLALLTLIPGLSTWLPNAFGYVK